MLTKGSTNLFLDLRLTSLKDKFEKKVSYVEMRNAYNALSEELGSRFKSEKLRTFQELSVLDKIKSSTKLNIDTSVWIGNRNIDLFITALKSSENGFKGLAIEVDGNVHDSYQKMCKDNSKYELIHKLKIGLYTIENHDLNSHQFMSFIRKINTLKRLDTRGRYRLWRNIYLVTIYKNIDRESVKKYLNPEKLSVISDIGELLC